MEISSSLQQTPPEPKNHLMVLELYEGSIEGISGKYKYYENFVFKIDNIVSIEGHFISLPEPSY
ncbi:hypothetical protein [Clostridium kluyveri]|uniref:Uncharacterized protein n=1 Tax=Clostridium kluyveri (strain ATCC 8527 / DSM 555 / NBRC 12016 / NCIMB 10680 / K1) TaxID=431943 RepID=A5N059_CLOK5|nr:hypothetical protein [Clostridium kluyveri]EDK34505.1 Hypothetical protein CKL_2493 [Clostridium kluyveri DSM 555]